MRKSMHGFGFSKITACSSMEMAGIFRQIPASLISGPAGGAPMTIAMIVPITSAYKFHDYGRHHDHDDHRSS
jgi:hypothetical protein